MANRKLQLYFKDETNNSKTLSVDYPKQSYSPTEVGEAMDTMIASNVLITKNGPIASKAKAEIATVEKEEIELA
ncbi:DUF2922 domain-containing protein [uncultured Anaerococcus sp.]|uniref:DUF2922 domain-containing protein n=1 Tax=uncultured Anaerococcus sp. TaxID=293428 RepID=UPI00261BAEA2|nr:DUF2922 domain-containing protein [uncultured Anaerococcus sp.]